MRLFHTLPAAAALALAAACGSGQAAAPATTTATPSTSMTVPSVPELTPTAVVDRPAYLAQLHDELGATNYAYIGDDELVDLGDTVCRAIDKGLDRNRLGQLAEQSDIPPAVLTEVIAAATTHLCPQHAGF